MKYFWIGMVILLMSVGCRGGGTSTPTPFPTLQTGTAVSVANNAATVMALADLAADPEQYDGAFLQLTGQYRRAPLLVCSSDPHPSPATWTLNGETAVIQAGGLDSQMRALLPDNLTITVEGRWQLWRGVVGCGKRAVPANIWYLAVNRIVTPSLLTQVTLTPSPGAVANVATSAGTNPLPTSDGIPIATPGFPQETPITDITSEAPPPTQDSEPTEELPPTPVLEITPVLPPPSGATPTNPGEEVTIEVPTTTAPPEGGTPEPETTPTLAISPTFGPSPTFDPNATPTFTPTPTATGGVPTSTPGTPTTPSGSTVVDKGEIGPEELATELIAANETHNWQFVVTSSDFLTVSVAAPDGMDAAIAITNQAGTVLVEQNNAAAGQIETINKFQLPTAGTYQIRVRIANGAATSYSLIAMSEGSYAFLFAGILSYGEAQVVVMREENDHFWHFYGNVGDTLTMTADPQDQGDPFMELYGPDTENISGFIDEGGSGEVEQILDFTLPVTGFYAIRIGEFDFAEMQYLISLDRG